MLVDALKALTPLIAILSLAVVELCALMHQIDGMVFTAVIGAIAGLGGFSLEKVLQARRVKDTADKLAKKTP